MKGTIYNEGEHPVRAIVDGDTINDLQIEADATEELDALGGIIELHGLEMGVDGGETARKLTRKLRWNGRRNDPFAVRHANERRL
ncbi:hypothetical protein [Paraburkholderia sediminicola]|uniref:hypothetical protein n=1 Tax=Paraburkholderia TaxID=1822464 RepID=UPI000E742692